MCPAGASITPLQLYIYSQSSGTSLFVQYCSLCAIHLRDKCDKSPGVGGG